MSCILGRLQVPEVPPAELLQHPLPREQVVEHRMQTVLPEAIPGAGSGRDRESQLPCLCTEPWHDDDPEVHDARRSDTVSVIDPVPFAIALPEPSAVYRSENQSPACQRISLRHAT
jgi:hypothetical protein